MTMIAAPTAMLPLVESAGLRPAVSVRRGHSRQVVRQPHHPPGDRIEQPLVQRPARRSRARPRRSRRPNRPPGGAASEPPSARGDDAAGLGDDQRGGRDVVREVRADRAVAGARGRPARARGARRTTRQPDVDVRVELAGDDPRHVERRRAEVEEPAVHRRAVDELLEQHRHRDDGPAAQSGGPEQRARDRRWPTARSGAAHRRRARRARPRRASRRSGARA